MLVYLTVFVATVRQLFVVAAIEVIFIVALSAQRLLVKNHSMQPDNVTKIAKKEGINILIAKNTTWSV